MHGSWYAIKGKEKAVFLDQILRRQEEYIKSLGPIKKLAQKKPLRIKKTPPTLTVVPVYEQDEPVDELVDEIESAVVVEVAETVQELSLIDTRLIPAYVEPTDGELRELEKLESGTFELDEAPSKNTTFDLVSIFDKYVPKTKGAMAKVGAKMVGLPVPDDIHARMLKFIETNKDKPNAPKSLKDLGLMCVGYTLDSLELPQTDGESSL